jgi:hypothetical protein
MEVSFISRLHRLTQLQPARVISRQALSDWLLRELEPPPTSGVNVNGGNSSKDVASDSRNEDPGVGSEMTAVEEPIKNIAIETSESKRSTMLSCHFVAHLLCNIDGNSSWPGISAII